MSTGTPRWGRLAAFASVTLVPLSLLFLACSSDDEDANANGVPLPPAYEPVEAAAQAPLPPGAGGPRDSGIPPTPPPPMDAGRDTSPPVDASVPDTAPADAATGG
jgi:hypothetical protein